ncbi:MAG: hypothetical protein K9M99_04515 [Candidatus Cloacimonetes bacterium]|nr:hypothetical protein [Candidatus Cloacimonadota bacterium]
MKKILNTVVTVIGWLVLLLALSSIGFATSNPAAGVPLYMLFFLIVFAGIYYYVSKQKHEQKKVVEKKSIFPRIIGGVILVISLLMPWFVFAKINLTLSTYFIMIITTAVMIFLAFLAVRMVNKGGENTILRLLGYSILIALAAIPALAAIYFFLPYFNRPYDALGTAYWCYVAIAVLSWWGFSLIGKKS